MQRPLGFKHFEDRLLVLRKDTCILSDNTISVWAPKVPWWGLMYVGWWLLDSTRQCQGNSNQISKAESFSANKAIKCMLELYASLDQTLLWDAVLGFVAVPANSMLTSTFWRSFLFLPHVYVVHTSSTEVVFGECHKHKRVSSPDVPAGSLNTVWT